MVTIVWSETVKAVLQMALLGVCVYPYGMLGDVLMLDASPKYRISTTTCKYCGMMTTWCLADWSVRKAVYDA